MASKLSWTTNIIKRSKWIVNRIWASVRDTEATATQVLRGDRPPPQSRQGGAKLFLIAVKRVEAPLKWSEQFGGLAGPGLERKFGGGVPASREDIMVDASPWGVAGILEHTTSGQALEFFADRLLPQDEIIFGHKIGEASGQAVWEALALLIALRLWAKFRRDH